MHGENADVSNVLSCTSCEFETRKSQCLRNHINAQHLNQKRYSCPSCDFKSYHTQSVEVHIRSRHKESNPVNMTKTTELQVFEGKDCKFKTKKLQKSYYLCKTCLGYLKKSKMPPKDQNLPPSCQNPNLTSTQGWV